ncbi:hypothetical protein [Streptomyces sp. G1]|uniref:hypothetical protein n=1 Tax=Streptomyces sp. G1 TaxID=361572 RepID=UPI00202F9D0D|nr:hypothetical protein [Streptomyces sp. G1]MCM1976507.1 hypothetical protein [Streptomyces sp. G1]
MANQPDGGSRRSIEDMYDYTTSILGGSEDYSLINEGVFRGWYYADGNPCTMRRCKFGPGGTPVPLDPNAPPPVHRP